MRMYGDEESAAVYDGWDTAHVSYIRTWLYDTKMDLTVSILIWSTIVDDIKSYRCLLVGNGELIHAYVLK